MFRDRQDAGKRLAQQLGQHKQFKPHDTVVLALPRGGVPVGYEIAQALGAALDILPVRKIGHPSNPEYALCATDELGTLLCNEAEQARVDANWLDKERKKEQTEARRRAALYRDGRPTLPLSGKTVIVVDDGAATGLTLRLALKRALAEHPAKLIAAVPVLPAELAGRLQEEGIELEALEAPTDFMGAVGAYYQSFKQVSDQEVISLLRSASGGILKA